MPNSPKAYSTIGTVLKIGDSVAALAQLTKIKSYPDLGGTPETIETTDLEDSMQTFVTGVQSVDSMEFTANYTPEGYAAVKAAIPAEGTEKYYQIEFGTGGAAGKFQWKGSHSVRVSGGEVNGVREMVITCVPGTEIEMVGESGTT